jgi:hypothetical protein
MLFHQSIADESMGFSQLLAVMNIAAVFLTSGDISNDFS